jgi:16S rRNA processing protein RimM
VTLLPGSDDPDRFAPGSTFVTDSGRSLTVSSCRPYRDLGLLLRFEGVDDRSGAEALRDAVLTIDPSQRRDLDEGEYWPGDLIGLVVIDAADRMVGTVSDVVIAQAQDRLVVATSAGGQFEIPFVDDLVDDPAEGQIRVRLPAGLLDEPPGES